MNKRIELGDLLKSILGNKNVYYQAPPTLKMSYPCIKYELNSINSKAADNRIYSTKRRYSITLIHQNPDNEIVDKLIENNFYFDRVYCADGLYHYVFTIYY